MDVYLVPIGRDRYESYFEAADDEDDPAPAQGQGVFARLRANFSAQLREAERARHERRLEEPSGAMASLHRRVMRWVAERVAEQRLLWHMGRADEATLHVPDTLDPAAAERLMRDMLQRDADRHLKRLGLNAIGLVIATPFALVPGPNVFGYLFSFTVVGHFLAWRGAKRGLGRVRWRVAPNADLADLGRALSLDVEARVQRIHDLAGRLRLPRLATFVERMTAPTA